MFDCCKAVPDIFPSVISDTQVQAKNYLKGETLRFDSKIDRYLYHKGKIVVSNSRTLSLWKYEEKTRNLKKTEYQVESGECIMAVLPQGDFVMANRNEFAVYSMRDLTKLRVLRHSNQLDIVSLETSPCRAILIVCGRNHVQVWDAESINMVYQKKCQDP